MHRNRGASSSFIAGVFAQESREVRPAFIAPYGLHLMPRIRCTACRYGFIYCCTVFEESTACLNAVQTALNFQHKNQCTDCSLIAQESRKGYGLSAGTDCVFIGTNS